MKKLFIIFVLLAFAVSVQAAGPISFGGGSVATDTIFDAAGDLVQGTGANTAAKLTKGAEGTILRAGAASNAYTTATYPNTGTAYALTIFTATNVLGELALGTTGKLLMGATGAVPGWTPYTLPATVPTVGKVLISDGTNLIGSTALGTAAYAATGDFQATDTELGSLAGLTFADASIIQLTGAGTSAVLTSGGNSYFLKSATDNSALMFATPAEVRTALGLVISTNVQAYDADLTTYAGITPSADIQTFLAYANLAAIKAGISLDDLVTLSGVADGAVNLGAFTGSTITDNQTIKAALQLVETAVEGKQATLTTQILGTLINSADAKTAPVDADYFGLMDSEATNILKKLSWAYVKSLLWASPTITGLPTFGNGTTSSGYIGFLEDSTNGTKKVILHGPEDVGAVDLDIYLPAAAGTLALTANKISDLAASTSSELAGKISDETGTGVVVYSDSPTFVDDVTVAAAGVKMTGANGSLTILGLGDGADEDVKIDLNTTANTIIVSSPASSATTVSFSALNLATTGTVSGGSQTPVIDDPDNFAANFTGTNLYGGTFIANAAGTAALPAVAVGMNFTVILEGANAVILNPDGGGTADTITMNGLAAAQDENITSSTSGAICTFQYRAADSWMATCNGFAEATPP